MPKPINVTETSLISNHKDHHSFLRSNVVNNLVVQSYRNYSRICKQYTYGDKKLEHVLQMELRNAFRIPFTCTTPVELVKYGAVNLILSLVKKNGKPFG